MRRISLFLMVCTFFCWQCQEGAPPPRPNILFIFSDDHAIQSISAYGSQLNKTPNIDRIAEEGVIFHHATVTNSICAPSRATILTGKHSHANGKKTNIDTFDVHQQIFPRLLQQVGYETALIGKWHLKSNPEGFDYWDILPGQGSYYNPDFISASGRRRVNGYNTDVVTNLSLEWLKNSRNQDKPFMLMCQYKAPHRVWAPSPDHLTDYDNEILPEPETLFDDYSNRSEFVKDNEMMIAKHMMEDYDLKIAGSATPDVLGRTFKNPELRRMTEEQRAAWDAAYEPKNELYREMNLSGEDLVRWKYQRYIKDYLRTVASVDDNIGRLLHYLDSTGLSENTIVVYSSDQGFYLGEHGWYDKRWMYEESLHTPLVMRWPGKIKPGTQIKELVQNIDYAPTFLEAAGTTIPEDMHGVSLLPLVNGEADSWRTSIYYHYYEEGEHNVPKHEGVRTDDYKLISFYGYDTYELYDLNKDPQELNNVAESEDYRTIRSELEQELERLKKQYGVVD